MINSFSFLVISVDVQYVFTDPTNRYMFTTTDFLSTVKGYALDFTPDDITFDERKPFSILSYDKSDRLRRVRTTRNWFKTECVIT